MTQSSNEVKPTDENENLPSVIPQLGRGHEEGCEQEDLEIPRAKLIQPTSEEATAENPADRIGIGLIVNSMTKEKLPDTFIPIYKFTTYIRWNPRKKDAAHFDPAYDPGALIFTTTDPNDPRVLEGKVFGPNGEAPKVTKYLNFLVYFVGTAMPCVLSFAKTSFKAGVRLNSLTRYAGGDMFTNKFKIKSVQKEVDGTKFFVFEVQADGKTDTEQYKIAEKMWEDFRGKQIKVHQPEDETTAEPDKKKDQEEWPE